MKTILMLMLVFGTCVAEENKCSESLKTEHVREVEAANKAEHARLDSVPIIEHIQPSIIDNMKSQSDAVTEMEKLNPVN